MYSHRKKQGEIDALTHSFEQGSSSLVTTLGGYAPDYRNLINEKASETVSASLRSVTADMADPNVTPPTLPAGGHELGSYSMIAFHVVFPATGSGNLEVWVDGGKDKAGADIGWLLIDIITGITNRKEYYRATGQRVVYLRLTGTANVDVANPATVRACGVA